LAENADALKNGPPLERALPIRRAAQWIGAFLVIAFLIVAYANFSQIFPERRCSSDPAVCQHQPLTDTTLEVTPGDMEVAVGSVAEIQIATGGKPPAKSSSSSDATAAIGKNSS